MIVCHCQSISDRAIRDAIRAGARTHHQVLRNCRAGGRCGGCRPLIEEILESESRGSSTLRSASETLPLAR